MKTTGLCVAVAAVLVGKAAPTVALAIFATASTPIPAQAQPPAVATVVAPAATQAARRPDGSLPATQPARCGAPADLARLSGALTRTARQLTGGRDDLRLIDKTQPLLDGPRPYRLAHGDKFQQ